MLSIDKKRYLDGIILQLLEVIDLLKVVLIYPYRSCKVIDKVNVSKDILLYNVSSYRKSKTIY